MSHFSIKYTWTRLISSEGNLRKMRLPLKLPINHLVYCKNLLGHVIQCIFGNNIFFSCDNDTSFIYASFIFSFVGFSFVGSSTISKCWLLVRKEESYQAMQCQCNVFWLYSCISCLNWRTSCKTKPKSLLLFIPGRANRMSNDVDKSLLIDGVPEVEMQGGAKEMLADADDIT